MNRMRTWRGIRRTLGEIPALAVGFSLWAGYGCGLIPGNNDGTTGGPPTVAGVFNWGGDPTILGEGTVTFTQDGQQVHITGATYTFSGNRDIVGDGTLDGSTLRMIAVPKNGDADYRADLEFVFGLGGQTFKCTFSDTNGDAGVKFGRKRPGN